MHRIRLARGLVGPMVIASAFAFLGASQVAAQTIEAALVHAYQNNPQLNAQRASVRSTDEGVPTALSGYRPRVSVTASAGTQRQEVNSRTIAANGNRTYNTVEGETAPRSVGVTATQTLFNGQQTANRVRAAESQVSAAREGLRILEQTVLQQAAGVYMDFLRDTAIVELNRSNVRVLEETLRQVRDRFAVGEVTRTDVAQSEAQLAARPFQSAANGIQPQHHSCELSSHHRHRAVGAARAGPSDRSAATGDFDSGHRNRADGESERDVGDVRHRRGASAGSRSTKARFIRRSALAGVRHQKLRDSARRRCRLERTGERATDGADLSGRRRILR